MEKHIACMNSILTAASIEGTKDAVMDIDHPSIMQYADNECTKLLLKPPAITYWTLNGSTLKQKRYLNCIIVCWSYILTG